MMSVICRIWKIFTECSCLNVIDRCDYPMKMIRDIFHVLRTDGICLLSVVLPLNDFVLDSRGQTRPAAEPLPQGIPRCGSHSDFESCVQTFYELVLQPVVSDVRKSRHEM